MRILITNHTLEGRAGTELYVRDLSLGLHRRGHEIVCYSPKLGEVAEEIAAAGIVVVDQLDPLTWAPELIHAHHYTAMAPALFRFPDIPALFVCHGLLPWPETPLIRFRQVVKYIAVDTASRDRLRQDLGLKSSEISIIPNGIDLTRFQPGPIPASQPSRRARALVLSNQAQNTAVQPLREACARNGITLDVRGAGVGDPIAAPEQILPDYGLVFAKGRAAIEAMACGCMVILADYGKWGGKVTLGNWQSLRSLNFGLRAITRQLDETAIADEIATLDWSEAQGFVEKVTNSASLETMLEALLIAYEAVLAKELEPCASPTTEAAQFAEALSPLLYERDSYATKLYEETKLRLGNEATSAGLLVQAMVHLREGPDPDLVRRLAEQILFLQPGHPIAQDVLAKK